MAIPGQRFELDLDAEDFTFNPQDQNQQSNGPVIKEVQEHDSSDIPSAPQFKATASGNQDEALASEDNIFDELKTTRSTSWQFELRQMERQNRLLAEELQALISRKKKRKRRKGLGQLEKDCANCHTRVTPEWRRGPSGQRDLCNSCGLRWAKQNGRVSPRKYGASSEKSSTSPAHVSPGNASGATDAHKNSASPALEGQHVKQEESELAQPTQREKNRDTVRGTMPPKIEEGEEPPHPTVLPT